MCAIVSIDVGTGGTGNRAAICRSYTANPTPLFWYVIRDTIPEDGQTDLRICTRQCMRPGSVVQWKCKYTHPVSRLTAHHSTTASHSSLSLPQRPSSAPAVHAAGSADVGVAWVCCGLWCVLCHGRSLGDHDYSLTHSRLVGPRVTEPVDGPLCYPSLT